MENTIPLRTVDDNMNAWFYPEKYFSYDVEVNAHGTFIQLAPQMIRVYEFTYTHRS